MTEVSVPGVSNTSVVFYATDRKPQIQVRRPGDQKLLYYVTTDAWFKDFLKLFGSCKRKTLRSEITKVSVWAADEQERNRQITKHIKVRLPGLLSEQEKAKIRALCNEELRETPMGMEEYARMEMC